MSLEIICPNPVALSDIVATDCPENWGQIVRIAFQRVGYAFTDITDEAEWDLLLAANDDTKLQIGPIHENFTAPAGELITEGGDDNTTSFGQPVSVGKATVTAGGRYRGISAETKRSLEQFTSESYFFQSLGVIFINEFGQIISNTDPDLEGGSDTVFPIQNYFISDVDNQGLNTNNLFNFSFTFPGGWSDYFKISNTNWNILGK
jgi:hypothetical protein